MRRKPCCRGRGCSYAAIVLGIIILLGLILPSGVWWLICAAALICGGIMLMRS